jgi:hypothetical protein
MHELDTLYDTYDTFVGELKDANEKIRQAGGKPSVGDLEVLDTISHGIKSTKTTIAMIENEMGNKSSRGYYDDMSRDGRNMDGRSYGYDHGMSTARGANARRDSMGRYSRGDETEEELLDKLAMIRNRR